jgi:hypothetical protein
MKAKSIYEGFIGFEERSAELYLEISVRFYGKHIFRRIKIQYISADRKLPSELYPYELTIP